jgi:hypothetical protein
VIAAFISKQENTDLMPKKTRKAKMRAAQRPIRVGYPVGPTSATKEPMRESFAPRATSISLVSSRSAVPMAFDYRYVFQDLRRIALLAGTFFALMFVIWFLVEVEGIHLIPGLL